MHTILIFSFLASFIGTITGFGTSLILVPILSLRYSLPETFLFVGIVHLFGDFWKILIFRKGINLKLILLFGLPGILISFIAAYYVENIPNIILSKFLGGFLIADVLFILFHPKWKKPKSNINALVGGGLSGFFAGLTGVGGAVRSAFLSAYNLDKYVFLFTSGAIGVLIDSSRVIGYYKGGIKLLDFSITTLAFAVIISFFGALAAKKVVNIIPQKKFGSIVALLLFAVGIKYLLF